MIRLFGSSLGSALSRAMGKVADIEIPSLVLNPAIKAYSLGFGVDLDEAQKPENGYGCFGDFFARSLKPGMRPITDDQDAFISPCDGKLIGVGDISESGDHSFMVKNNKYKVDHILGVDEAASSVFAGGSQMVIYLHPRDYHRVHIPLDAKIIRVRHIPGKRFPVAPWSEARVDGIYGKNERVVFDIELINGGSLALVMVAAFGVGNIETGYGPAYQRDTVSAREHDKALTMQRGDELGAFRLGSTVVILWTKGSIELNDNLKPGRVLLGQKFGMIAASNV